MPASVPGQGRQGEAVLVPGHGGHRMTSDLAPQGGRVVEVDALGPGGDGGPQTLSHAEVNPGGGGIGSPSIRRAITS